MHIKPNTLAMTAMLAFMTALGPLATDLYLPSLPHIGAELGATPAAVQLTLSAYLIGFSAGQIFYGPISDAVGRKPVLLAAFGIFLAATVACALAGSIETLIGARVAQAFGGAGPIILARTVVRDLYEGPRAGRELSMMGSIMGVTPVIAPVFGGFLQVAFGWRASFVAMAAAALALMVIAALLLPETIRVRQKGGLSPAAILRSYAVVLSNGTYRVYVGLLALSYAGLFAFISASSFVMQGVYGLGEVAFGLAFASCSASFVVGTLIGTRLVSRKGFDRTIAVGVLLLALGGVGQFLGVLLFPRLLLALIVPEMLFFMGIGLVLPQAMAGAMTPFPDRAGAASSLAGFVQMVFASVTGAVIGLFVNGSAMPLVVASALAGAGALALFHTAGHLRRRSA